MVIDVIIAMAAVSTITLLSPGEVREPQEEASGR